MKIGNGAHSYEWRSDWAKLPSGIKMGRVHGVVVDRHDNILIFNTTKDAVMKFDREGNFLGSWGEQFAEGAHGMYLSPEKGAEYLYLTDTARHFVVKTTLEGKEIHKLPTPPLPEVYPSIDQYKPTDTAVAPNGDVYVCDGYGQSWVHQYDRDGKYIRSWGGKGSEPGKMSCPHGIWIDTRQSEPRVYVADRANLRIQIFSLEGKHLGFVEGMLRRPCCFYEHKGDMIIPDLYGRVTILDKNDQLIMHLGDSAPFDLPGTPNEHIPDWPNLPRERQSPGQFIAPHAACVDSRGDIYVGEWVLGGRLTKLVKV
jgi:DNA-binding beta-propeller fold protein YncE